MAGDLLQRLQRRGVKLLVEVGPPFISQPIETARNAFDKTVTAKDREPVAGVITHRNAEVFHGPRCEIPLVAHQLQNLIVDRVHPIRALSHAIISGCITHIDTDMGIATPYSSLNVTSQGVKFLYHGVATP